MRRALVAACRIASIALLGLAIGVAVLWPRSYRRSQVLTTLVDRRYCVIAASLQGGLYYIVSTEGALSDSLAWIDEPIDPRARPIRVPHDWHGFGVGIAGDGEFRARVPSPAAIVGLAAASAASWFAARRVRADRVIGRACGFDLRATPDRDPECGTSSPPP